MSEFQEFATTVFDALRPIAPPDLLDDVDRQLEHGQTSLAVIEILVGAAQLGLSMPADVLDDVRARVGERTLFRPKDADLLEHYLPMISVRTAA